MRTVLSGMLSVVLVSLPMRAQAPTFEVASVKKSPPDAVVTLAGHHAATPGT
jgi:hypothetical protein